MATSNFSGSDHNRSNNNPRLLLEDEQIRVKPRRKSSSTKANEINKKKVARRGMGVEKLERLMNKDKTTTTTSSPSHSHSHSPSIPPFAFIPCSTIATSFAAAADHHHHHHHHHHHPVASVQLPFSKINGMMTGVHGCGGLSLQVPQQFFVHKMQGINGHTAFYPNGQVSCVNVKGNCKELPSIPTDYCADCYKKKRGVRVIGNEMMFDGVNPSFQDSSHQGAKVVALHKKASTIGQGNHVVMEYEFFPGAKNNKNKTKTHQMNYQAVGCEGASAATNGSTNYIDLSLKLSY